MEVIVNYGSFSPKPVWSDYSVVIVDSDMQNLMNLKWMFEQCEYNNVAYLQTAEDALWLLGHHAPVDLLICEAFVGGFQLLSAVRQDFKFRDLQVILYSSSNNHDDDVILGLGHDQMGVRALELGASAFYSNPISMEVVRHLWQHVFLKKIQSCSNCDINNNSDVSVKPKKKSDGVELMMKSKRMKKKKERMRWTEDLERKFLAAVDEIRRCDPNGVTASRIRGLMREEGLSLTIPQINSHLQKYHKQKTSDSSVIDHPASGDGGGEKKKNQDDDSSVTAQLQEEWSDADFQALMIN